ncbi:hypothetical protein JOD82_001848 [Paenibacillus sp. 1182]|uniref:hypothetical protein n=1 Tax=Paenibacillus sp. 1182 TaxID=2806565 RepID=UPI001AE76E77|nr:hypothetical protein [Paenibacillus sp. 1182]MBP1308828.1 hypothetical protein [Paenibacillus sp. 1182]
MKKVVEYTNVTYHYDSREERDEHVEYMESDGWECSGQIKETLSLHDNEFVWCGKFTKYTQ